MKLHITTKVPVIEVPDEVGDQLLKELEKMGYNLSIPVYLDKWTYRIEVPLLIEEVKQ